MLKDLWGGLGLCLYLLLRYFLNDYLTLTVLVRLLRVININLGLFYYI